MLIRYTIIKDLYLRSKRGRRYHVYCIPDTAISIHKNGTIEYYLDHGIILHR